MDFVQTRPPFLKLAQDGQGHLMRQLWTLFFKMDKVHGLVWTLSILLDIDRMRPCLDLAHLIPERNGQSPDKAACGFVWTLSILKNRVQSWHRMRPCLDFVHFISHAVKGLYVSSVI